VRESRKTRTVSATAFVFSTIRAPDTAASRRRVERIVAA
jgi:hypothetical protein